MIKRLISVAETAAMIVGRIVKYVHSPIIISNEKINPVSGALKIPATAPAAPYPTRSFL